MWLTCKWYQKVQKGKYKPPFKYNYYYISWDFSRGKNGFGTHLHLWLSAFLLCLIKGLNIHIFLWAFFLFVLFLLHF